MVLRDEEPKVRGGLLFNSDGTQQSTGDDPKDPKRLLRLQVPLLVKQH